MRLEALVANVADGAWAGELQDRHVGIGQMIGDEQDAAVGRHMFPAAETHPVHQPRREPSDHLEKPRHIGSSGERRLG